MSILAYAFEAKSIQSYITAGGRLRDLSGGSAVVDSLCALSRGAAEDSRSVPFAGLLDDALAICGLSKGERPKFTRRAAGAFTFVVSTARRAETTEFSSLWPLLVNGAAPGLEYVETLVEAPDEKQAIEKAIEFLRSRRNLKDASLPLVGAPVARAQRTGEAAVARDRLAEEGEKAFIDRATARKRLFKGDSPALAERFLGQRENNSRKFWPTDLEKEFPFLSENHTVAVVHADANRMGHIFKSLGEKLQGEGYVAALGDISREIEKATEKALHKAAAEHLRPEGKFDLIPARPILAGGDDISIILRADLAIPYVRTFIEEFEEQAKNIVACAKKCEVDTPLPTFTAGVAFVGSSQPFSAAHELAESLCKYAKRVAKEGLGDDDPVPSTLAFHRATSSLLEDYDRILKDDLTVTIGGVERRLTDNPYVLGNVQTKRSLPKLEHLQELTKLLGQTGASRGPARQLMSMAHDFSDGAMRYSRWLSVLISRDGPDKAFADDLEYFLEELGRKPGAPGLFVEREFGAVRSWQSPLADAVALYAATRGPERSQGDREAAA